MSILESENHRQALGRPEQALEHSQAGSVVRDQLQSSPCPRRKPSTNRGSPNATPNSPTKTYSVFCAIDCTNKGPEGALCLVGGDGIECNYYLLDGALSF
jgi:hypothetical protein